MSDMMDKHFHFRISLSNIVVLGSTLVALAGALVTSSVYIEREIIERIELLSAQYVDIRKTLDLHKEQRDESIADLRAQIEELRRELYQYLYTATPPLQRHKSGYTPVEPHTVLHD